MTPEQFFAWVEHPTCSMCDKTATWFPHAKNEPKIVYCDEHFPYKDPKDKEKEWKRN